MKFHAILAFIAFGLLSSCKTTPQSEEIESTIKAGPQSSACKSIVGCKVYDSWAYFNANNVCYGYVTKDAYSVSGQKRGKAENPYIFRILDTPRRLTVNEEDEAKEIVKMMKDQNNRVFVPSCVVAFDCRNNRGPQDPGDYRGRGISLSEITLTDSERGLYKYHINDLDVTPELKDKIVEAKQLGFEWLGHDLVNVNPPFSRPKLVETQGATSSINVKYGPESWYVNSRLTLTDESCNKNGADKIIAP